MVAWSKASFNALKHGAYSRCGVLPGESIDDFNKLRRDIIDELNPNGGLEMDIVESMVRLVWRKQNLMTYRNAELARELIVKIRSKLEPYPLPVLDVPRVEITDQQRAKIKAEEAAARKEFGAATSDLVDMGDVATTQYLLNELELIERLDAALDRCLKRFLMVRGVKSMHVSPK